MTAGKNRARNFGKDRDEFYNLNDHDINTHMNSDYFKQIRLEMLNDVEPQSMYKMLRGRKKGN